MPTLTVNGARLHYEDTGAGPQTIVFAHGLLFSGRMFDDQVAALKGQYRCITFDFRGHGGSEVTPSGYDMETLTEDAAALIRAVRAAPCHFVGLSMGGFVGMRLAARTPELIRSLVLLETSADAEPAENRPRYRLMAVVARWVSMRLVVRPVTKVLFGRKFIADPARAGLREEWGRRLLANNPAGTYRATLGVVNRRPIVDEIGRIRVPALILVGDQDVATVPAKAQRIHERIPGSRLVILPGAGHSSTIEEPAAVNTALLEFLRAVDGA